MKRWRWMGLAALAAAVVGAVAGLRMRRARVKSR
jgi:hypothetical protein